VVASAKGENCCDHDDGTYGVDGGANTMQARLGFDESVADARWDVDIGLQEIFFMVLSKLWRPERGKVNSKVYSPNSFALASTRTIETAPCSSLIKC
jgi:hypothetical protein